MGPSKAQSALREPTCYFTPGSGSGQWWKWTIAGDSWAGQHTTWQEQQQNCRRDDYSLVKQWPACFRCLLTGLTLSLWIETDLVHETWELGRDKTYDNQHCWWLHSECSLQYKIDYTVTTEGVSSEKVWSTLHTQGLYLHSQVDPYPTFQCQQTSYLSTVIGDVIIQGCLHRKDSKEATKSSPLESCQQ